MFCKPGVLEYFTKLIRKHLCKSLFLLVASLRPATLSKKRLWNRCFPVNFVKFSRTPSLQNTSGRLLLFISQLAQRRCDNVVATSLLTLSQRFDTVENESCADVGFRRCDNVALRRYQDVATTFSTGFLGHFNRDYSDFFPFIET